MITMKPIRGGRGYFGNHLRANDYYNENESITGHWRGRPAKLLGLEGKEVTRQDFESLRNNLHPQTGEKLRQRSSKVGFHDIVVSAPKSYSIAALVGGDERLVEGFNRAVDKAFKRLEKFAGARDRSGSNYNTETITRTGNGIAAVFKHNTSRMLDPQLHTHLVFSNHTHISSEKRGGYYALQPKEMMEEAKRWITDQFHRDLAREAVAIGYKVGWDDNRMKLTGVGLKIEYKFSQRAQQRRKFERRYRKLFGGDPDAKRIEQFIKEGKSAAHRRFKDEYLHKFGRRPTKEAIHDFVTDWRSAKMASSSRSEVRLNQRRQLTRHETLKLDGMIARARLDTKEKHEEGIEQKTDKEEASGVDNKQPMDVRQETANQKKKVRAKKQNSRKQQRLKLIHYQRTVGRMEAIRRMRRGMAVAQALRGHPVVFMVQQLSTLNQRRR